MGEMQTVSLGSLGVAFSTGPFGSAVSAKHFRDSGIPMLRGSNLSEHIGTRLNENELVYIDEDLATTFSRCIATVNDLVFTCWGTVGQVGFVAASSTHGRYLVSNKQMKMTPDVSKVDPLFLYYFLSQPRMVSLIKGQAIGSSVPGFNLGQLKDLPVRLPPISEQQAIAEVLGALDEKIAANDRTQQVAGELARALFDRAAKSGVKHIVRGVATLISRGITPKYTDNNGITVLNQKCVRDQWVSLEPARGTVLSSARENKLLRQDDVLVNSTGFGTLGRAARWTRDLAATVDSHISIVRFDADIVDPVCAGFGLLRLEKQIESLAEGSTGQTELRRDLLAGLEILVPSEEGQVAVGVELAALDAHALALEDENHRLATTRDELLPLLMSGKVRVRDAEKVVEEVV